MARKSNYNPREVLTYFMDVFSTAVLTQIMVNITKSENK